MNATATPRPRARKQLRPVEVEVTHLAYSRRLGLGTLDIASGGQAQTYLLEAVRDGDQLTGMRLLKLASGDRHDVDLTVTPWVCDCPDASNRPERPGGCKHVVALRLAAERLRAAAE
jgi:hypothetical protein